jgi:fatty acid synthase subunit beta
MSRYVALFFSFLIYHLIFIIQGQQYVCAGELVALQTMTDVLNYLKIQDIHIAKVQFCILLTFIS